MKKIIKRFDKIKLAGFILTGTTFFCLAFVSMNQGTPDGLWVAPKAADSTINPLIDNALALTKGKAIYNQMCLVCHGAKGKGDGAAAKSLKPKPTDITSPECQLQTDGALYWKLTEGRKKMASYKKILKDEQRWQIVNYMRELGKTTTGK